MGSLIFDPKAQGTDPPEKALFTLWGHTPPNPQDAAAIINDNQASLLLPLQVQIGVCDLQILQRAASWLGERKGEALAVDVGSALLV